MNESTNIQEFICKCPAVAVEGSLGWVAKEVSTPLTLEARLQNLEALLAKFTILALIGINDFTVASILHVLLPKLEVTNLVEQLCPLPTHFRRP